MERNREVRRASIVGSNGFNGRRHRTSMLRDSPDEDGGVELQESVRLRDRAKKDLRERERKREREKERERDLRERSSRSKRRRGERLISNRDDFGGDETSDESLNDDDYEDEEDATSTATRLIPTTAAAASISNHSFQSSLSQQQNSVNTNSVISNHHLQHRKSFPPASSSSSSKVFKAAAIWKPDEIINVSVPRKARSASTKRSHDRTSTSSNNNSGGGEQVHRQASTSPDRQGGVSTSTPSPAAAMSPPNSNAPFRKKLKSGGSNGGQKLKPPKAVAKQSSSNPEELEIEIAEVLYGLMTQSQVPSSKKEDSREVHKTNVDVKPHILSPISNSNSANKQILGPNSSPLQPVAPKRKGPWQIQENSSYGGSAMLDMDKMAKSEVSPPNSENIPAFDGENVSETVGSSASHGPPAAPPPPELTASASVKVNLELKTAAEGLRESKDSILKKDMSSPEEKKSTAVRNEEFICMDTTLTATASASALSTMIKAYALVSDVENQRQQKLEIDLMAPPSQVRSSPEREIKIQLKATAKAADQKPSLSIGSTELRTDVLNDKLDGKRKMKQSENAAVEESKDKWTDQEAGLKEFENKARGAIDVQLDLEKPVRNGNAAVNSSGNKSQLYNDKQQQQEIPLLANREELHSEKSSQSKSSMPLAVSMANWPGGLSPMGYMAPLQGVVSMDGSTVAPAPIQTLFSQPRPKRCATHSYIARSIHCLQQVVKMNPFWHAAAGSASLFGSKSGNFNLMHVDLHGRSIAAPDKGNEHTNLANHKGSQTASTSDSGQRKQPILIQQPLPPVTATNLLGPAFIFPLNQQQAAVATVSARPSSTNSASVGGSTATSESSASAGATASVAAAMSFNYPAMAANEAQYLAILQNNAYPFPLPAVGPPPNYRGNPAPFNGSFYPPQMIHPSQLQHQQTPSANSPQLHQAHSNSSSSSQRHLLSQQQRPQSSGANTGAVTANSHDFPSLKSQPSQHSQQSKSPHPHPSQPRHFEVELGSSKGSPSTTDSKASPAAVNIYGQNFAMPIHPHNFALMTPPTALASAASVSGSSNQSEKQQQSLAQHGFAMSFGTVNGANTVPGIDITSMPQNHAIFQGFPEATRHNIQMMAASAAAAQTAQKKHFRVPEEDKSGGVDSVTSDAERKSSTPKAQGGVGKSIAFSRSDSANAHVSSAQANCVPNVASGTVRGSRLGTTSAMGATNMPNDHIQVQLQLQQKFATPAANRSKTPGASNGSVFSEHLNSSSITAANFPAGFPQNFVQSSTSPSQSPQWKSSTRTPASQAPSALASSGLAMTKNISQQHSRTQAQMQTQISFGGNHKQSSSQRHAHLTSNGAPSPPMMVGSPTTSSISRGASGSPRTASASTNTKTGQSSSLSSQQPKNSPSIPSQKSPSILGQPHVTSSSGSGVKHPQQQPPMTVQQAQLFFSNPYSHAQSAHLTYMQRRPADQQQQPVQQPSVATPTPPSGILTMCPSTTLTSSSTTMNDPAKAIAVATANVKGGGLPSQGIINAGTLLPGSFSYPHPVPAAVQVKPAEQKQPAG